MTSTAERFNADEVQCPTCGTKVTGILEPGDSWPKHKSAAASLGCPYPAGKSLTSEHFTRRRV